MGMKKQKLDGYTRALKEQRRGRIIEAILGAILSLVSGVAACLFVLWCVGAI